VTHGLSHLHKCDDIVVVSQGEIVDHGPYDDLMITNKILRDLVHSVGTSGSQHYQRQASDVGK
jgi:ABC-type multidrug transport system fused ATPase/permease subunit